MHHSLLVASSLFTLIHGQSVSLAQGPPPPPEILNSTKSGVIPVLPTPFNGTETLEGAIINPGPPLPNFTGLAGTATAQSNLPAATYVAQLPDSMFNPYLGTVIRGNITAVGTDSGVQFTINLDGLPDQAQYGPFPYHIHNLPVPPDGNCTGALGHLDPTNRGELHMCDTAQPQTCQVGDLSGKHGKITTQGSFSASYVDKYPSTQPGGSSYFGGLAFVIHTSNTSRMTCANFEYVGGTNLTNATGSMNATGVAGTGNATAPQETGTPPYLGAATNLATVGNVVLGVVVMAGLFVVM